VPLLFTDNETNDERLFPGQKNAIPPPTSPVFNFTVTIHRMLESCGSV
jgi:hypothetical protein